MYSILRSTIVGLSAIATHSTLFATGFPSDYGAVSRQQAFADAQLNGKPVVVYYSLHFCPGCRRLEALLRTDAVYSKWEKKFNFVSLDPDATRTFKQRIEENARWGVVVTPTLILFAPTGEYICYRVGSFNNTAEAAALPAQLMQYLNIQHASSSPRDCAAFMQK